jgi:hypothetical protein
MVQHTIIGIIGQKRHGKDSVANVLTKDYNFRRCAFATWLKSACQSIFMLSHDQLHGEKKDVIDSRWNVSARQIFQVVGTELFRKHLPVVLPQLNMGDETSLWCRCLRHYVESFDTPQRIVVPDVRFEDEKKLIESLGGHVVRVIRPHFTAGASDEHSSEKEQTTIDVMHTIVNDAGMFELQRETMRMMNILIPGSTNYVAPKIRGLKLDQVPTSVSEIENADVITLEPIKKSQLARDKRSREDKRDSRILKTSRKKK